MGNLNNLSAETRAVIDAVLEALDIPYAATVAHDETRARIMDERIMRLKVSMEHLAEAADRGDRFMDEKFTENLAYLRERLAEHPAEGYVTAAQARERCDAGATWSEAVRLDYQALDELTDAAIRERAARRATWPGGEPSGVRDAAATADTATAPRAETAAPAAAVPSTEDRDQAGCPSWCTGTHAPRYHVADEPEEDPQHSREVGRLDGDSNLAVFLTERDDMAGAHVELLHLDPHQVFCLPRPDGLPELLPGEVFLSPDEITALAPILQLANRLIEEADDDDE